MLQILGYLGCIYLALKGYEIYQQAWLQDRDEETKAQTIAVTVCALSVIAAILFGVWITNQANAIVYPIR